MTDRTNELLVWASVMSPSRQAVELLASRSDDNAFELSLARATRNLGQARFLLVNVTKIDAAVLDRAIAAFLASGASQRLCLAGHRSLLKEVEAAGFDNDRIGLMIDDVGLDTPCSDLIWDRIEAIRFNAEFIAHAAHDVRTACALEAMLGLAREIGLRTFGFDAVPDGASLSGRCDFDYLPVVPSKRGSSASRSRTSRKAPLVGYYI